MSIIDLSKKPDGATHIAPHSGLWIKYLGGVGGHYQFYKNDEWEMGFGCMSNSYLEIAKQDPWTGEGLPPVGTVCEQQTWTNREWRIVKVVAHFNGFAVCCWEESQDDSQVELSPSGDLRPIRTADQIAEEEKQAIIDWLVESHRSHGLIGIAGALYAEGYRKQVQP